MAGAKNKSPKLHGKRLDNPGASCPKHPDKDWRPLVQAAWDQGWWCIRARKYIKCWPPDKTKDMVKVPMTPSGSRTIRNVTRNFKASGLVV
jgi:hypothetical protein